MHPLCLGRWHLGKQSWQTVAPGPSRATSMLHLQWHAVVRHTQSHAHRLGRHDVELEQLGEEGGVLEQGTCRWETDGASSEQRGVVGDTPLLSTTWRASMLVCTLAEHAWQVCAQGVAGGFNTQPIRTASPLIPSTILWPLTVLGQRGVKCVVCGHQQGGCVTGVGQQVLEGRLRGLQRLRARGAGLGGGHGDGSQGERGGG